MSPAQGSKPWRALATSPCFASGNEGELELAELLAMIERVKDSLGQLVVAEKLRSRDGLVAILAIKYAPFDSSS